MQQLIIKDAFDYIMSLNLIVILSPVFIIIALLSKITSPGLLLFEWHVTGLDGRPFCGYKIRTMIIGADKLRNKLENYNEGTGPFFKMKKDPRVTKLGAILRKFSLDELPQLWSVLKGDMSLVGPRPTQVFEYEQLQEWQKARVKMKPGCTSLWMVSGKTRDFNKMVQQDLAYINNWSLKLDIHIILRTIMYMIKGNNY